MTKEFKYSIRSKKSGKLIAQEIVEFGNKEHPVTEDWETDAMVQLSLQNYKDTMVGKYLDVTIEEGSELDEYENHPRYIKIDDIELSNFISNNTFRDTAKHFGVSVGCIQKHIKEIKNGRTST